MKCLLLITSILLLCCGQAFPAGDIIDRWATNAETTAQTRKDVGLTPANIPYLPAGGGSGNVTGPSTHLADYAPLWGAVNSTNLVEGYLITAAGKALLDDANASVQRNTLGLGTAFEVNATQDQNATEILTLIKTVDGTGSGLDADHLDGRDPEDVMTDGANLPDGHAVKVYGDANWSASGGNVTAPNDIGDNKVMRGHGGAKNVQDSNVTIEDDGNVTTPGTVTASEFVSNAKLLPGIEMDVNSTLQEARDAWVHAQATDSTNGTEDVDVNATALNNGVDTVRMNLDADGYNNFRNADMNIDTGKKYRISGVDIGTKDVCFNMVDSDTAVAVADGVIAYTIPACMNSMDLVNVVCSVEDKGVNATTDVQIRRRRAGANKDMLSTKITIGDEWFAADESVNATNDDVNTGDQIYPDIDAIHSGTAPNGLSCVLEFRLP